MANQRKAKQILINPKFQLSFLITFGLLITLISIVYGISLEIFFQNFFSLGKEAGLGEDHIFFQFINSQRSTLYLIFFLTYFVVLFAFLYVCLKMSHKVAGPMYRLNMHLNEIVKDNNGKLKAIKFRENDYFIEIQDSFNELVKKQND